MKILLVLSLLFLGAFLLGACGDGKEQNGTEEGTSNKEQPKRGEGTDLDTTPTSTPPPTPLPFAARVEKKRLQTADINIKRDSRFTGCAPELDNFQTFGFVIGSESATKVDFGVITRLEYYALEPNAFGNLTLDDKVLDDFTHTVHKYNAKADLVIVTNDFTLPDKGPPVKDGGLWLGKSYVLVNLIDEIVEEVKIHEFDGVTIDFDNIPDAKTKDSYRFFIKRLRNRLNTTLSDQLQLNVVVPTRVIGGLLLQELDPHSVDYFLVPLAMINPLKRNLDLTNKQEDREIWKKVVTVIDEDKTSIIGASPGGVGIWNLGDMGEIGKEIKDKGKKNPIEQLIGPVICPIRGIIRWLLVSLTAVAAAFLLSAVVVYDLRGVLRKHIRYVIAVLVVIVLLFLSLVVADPFVEDGETPLFIALIIVVIIATGWQAWERKNRANYP